jgi:hypothetical protein
MWFLARLPGSRFNHLDAVRALEKARFRIARQGRPIVMTNGQRILVIPRHNPINALQTSDSAAHRPQQRCGHLVEGLRFPPLLIVAEIALFLLGLLFSSCPLSRDQEERDGSCRKALDVNCD